MESLKPITRRVGHCLAAMNRAVKRKALLGATAACVSALLTAVSIDTRADPYPPVDQKRPPIVLKHHGVFWAGGQVVRRTQVGNEGAGPLTVPIADQYYLVGQAYVEYFIPQNLRKGRKTLPIVMVPGGNLVGVHFLTTPDGREGWADFFLRRGFPVYIVDVPGRGRAGYIPDAFNNVRAGNDVAGPARTSQPNLGTFDSAAWLEWNTGPLPNPDPAPGPHDPTCIGNDARGNPGDPVVYCNGDRMPALDAEGYKHWLGALMPQGPVQGGANPGLIAVMDKVKQAHGTPAIYIGHSAGGSTGGGLANNNPELFRAVIAIEPAQNCNIGAVPITGLNTVPTLSIHGINQVGRANTPDCLARYAAINAAGGDATYLSLPTLPASPIFDQIPQVGIWGNDHIMMWNDNSDELAQILLDWIEQHVEKRTGKPGKP